MTTLVVHEGDEIKQLENKQCPTCAKSVYSVVRHDDTETSKNYVFTLCECGVNKYRIVLDALTGERHFVQIRTRAKKG
jgi:hypothetical protein